MIFIIVNVVFGLWFVSSINTADTSLNKCSFCKNISKDDRIRQCHTPSYSWECEIGTNRVTTVLLFWQSPSLKETPRNKLGIWWNYEPFGSKSWFFAKFSLNIFSNLLWVIFYFIFFNHLVAYFFVCLICQIYILLYGFCPFFFSCFPYFMCVFYIIFKTCPFIFCIEIFAIL